MTDFRLGCVVYRLASVTIRWVAEVNDSGQAENQLPHDLNICSTKPRITVSGCRPLSTRTTAQEASRRSRAYGGVRTCSSPVVEFKAAKFPHLFCISECWAQDEAA